MVGFISRLFQLKDFSSSTQRYRVQYRVILKNSGSREARGFLVLPSPESTHQQKLLSTVSALPGKPQRHREKRYKNEYVAWETQLPAGGSTNFSLGFDVEVSPLVLKTDVFHLSDYPIHTEALHAGPHLSHQNPDVQAMAKETAGDEQRVIKIVRKLQDRVQQELSYGNPIAGLYSAEEALQKRVVDCGGFDTLLVSLCRALKIPARVVSGFWARPNLGGHAGNLKNTMHAWAEFQLPDGRWFPLDPSVEYLRRHGRSKKRGGFGELGSDRIQLSKGSDVLIHLPDGSTHTADILQTPLVISKDPIALEYAFLTEKL